METIIVIIEGGGITEILNLPDDIMVEIRDYDIQQYPWHKENFVKDDYGEYYFPSLYTQKINYKKGDKLNG